MGVGEKDRRGERGNLISILQTELKMIEITP
jgi:hypothetical protein